MNITPEIQETAKELLQFLAAATHKLEKYQDSFELFEKMIKDIADDLDDHTKALEALFENDDTLGKRDDILKSRLDSHADKINNMGLAIESLELKLNN